MKTASEVQELLDEAMDSPDAAAELARALMSEDPHWQYLADSIRRQFDLAEKRQVFGSHFRDLLIIYSSAIRQYKLEQQANQAAAEYFALLEEPR